MLISKAPVRISLGGGGTDFPAYFDKCGGAVLSLTIDKYFYSVLQDQCSEKIEIESSDFQLFQEVACLDRISLNDPLMIPKAVLKHFNVKGPVHLSLKSDVPPGSGLGLSGAVTASLVKLIGGYAKKELSKKEVAELASTIEIDILKRPIGLQDQYASAYGGLNFITFSKGSVCVEPLPVSESNLNKLEDALLLFYTGIQRNSAQILSGQKKATEKQNEAVIGALNRIRESACRMRETLLAGDIHEFGRQLHDSWQHKKILSPDITNDFIDSAYDLAIKSGAIGGKITGAGGGGFLLLVCDEKHQRRVRSAMAGAGLQELKFKFEQHGAHLVLDHSGHFKSTLTPEGYLLGVSNIVKKIDTHQINKITDLIYKAYESDKQIFIMGNGGSAATASHFSNDLAKTTQTNGQRGLRVIPLTDNVPLMTAWGNDTGYENIFYGQLYNLLNPGDVVIGISGGGYSSNVLKALQLARERSAVTVGLCGFSGGRLKDLVDECIIVPSDNYQFIEDVHMILVHLIVSILKEQTETLCM